MVFVNFIIAKLHPIIKKFIQKYIKKCIKKPINPKPTTQNDTQKIIPDMKVLLEFIPLIAFFITARLYGILASAAAMLIATVVVYGIFFILQKGRLERQQWIVLILTVFFCGLSLVFHDDAFLKWKSTVINSVFAVGLLVSVALDKPLIKLAMGQVFKLSSKGWKILTAAWAVYFGVMAILHYYFAFFTPETTWIKFKTYGWMPIMLVFMGGQFWLLRGKINPDLLESFDEKNSKS